MAPRFRRRRRSSGPTTPFGVLMNTAVAAIMGGMGYAKLNDPVTRGFWLFSCSVMVLFGLGYIYYLRSKGVPMFGASKDPSGDSGVTGLPADPIVRYIWRCRESGMDDQAIRQALSDQGWDAPSIDAYLSPLSETTQPPDATRTGP